MYCQVKSAVICGIESKMVTVEVDVSDGLPGFIMVGYLTSEVKEAQDRVRTALRNCGFSLPPKKITVNLAPANIRKSGSGFDLPIAVAILGGYGLISQEQLEKILFVGELSLDGSIHQVRGILGMVMEAKRSGCHSCIIPEGNGAEGAVIDEIDVYGADSIRTVYDYLVGEEELVPVHRLRIDSVDSDLKEPDFADIKGQRQVKRCAEIAAAGMHNLLISGPPGAGKSMIASRIATLLPPFTREEALEVSQIHSIAGVLPASGILTQRPFRQPHHTITTVGLAGGGTIPRPGEISLAHRGILYLDELPEFQREALEVLRQPLEEREVRITRNFGQYVFPADFMLVASRNPCKCGYFPDREKCSCSEAEVNRYLHRISRPLLDRIDLHVEARPMQYDELVGRKEEEKSETIRKRVQKAHEIQKERYKNSSIQFNAQLTAEALEHYCRIGSEEMSEMRQVYEKKQLTARSYHKILKVARTIADLEESETIQIRHLSEALLYRPIKSLM